LSVSERKHRAHLGAHREYVRLFMFQFLFLLIGFSFVGVAANVIAIATFVPEAGEISIIVDHAALSGGGR